MKPYEKIQGTLDSLEEKVVELGKENASSARENTRSNIAFSFLRWYFVIIIIILLGVPLSNFFLLTSFDLKEVLLTSSSILGPTLGFIVAFYFKSEDFRG